MTKEINLTVPELLQLQGEENLDDWDQQLYQTLAVHDLEDYIERDIPEPHGEERAAWRKNRAMVVLMITSSLSPNVKHTLDNNGWDRKEKNPYTLYTFIKRAVPRLSADAKGALIVELGSLNMTSFDSIPAFQNRVQYLKRRLSELQVTADDQFYMWFVVNAMQSAYPDEYRFLVRDLEKEELRWDTLMIKLSTLAAKSRISNNYVKMVDKHEQHKHQRFSSPMANRDKKPDVSTPYCSSCRKAIKPNSAHCVDCGVCHTTKDCWSKDDTRAPSWWKEKRIKQTSATPMSSTQQNSNLISPATKMIDFTGLSLMEDGLQGLNLTF